MRTRLMLSICAALSMSVGVLIASDARADSTICNLGHGVMSGTFGNIVVPANGICGLQDATVNGNIEVQSDAAYVELAGNVTVNGNIKSRGGQTFIIDSRVLISNEAVGPNEVNGNVTIDSSNSVLICDANIKGNVVISNTNPGYVNFGSFLQGCNPLPPNGNFNTIGGNVSITDNLGPFGVLVVDNIVKGTLTCSGNENFTSSGNTAEKLLGQCAQ